MLYEIDFNDKEKIYEIIQKSIKTKRKFYS